MDLKAELLRERLESYAALSGGYPVPLAGMIYWAALCVYGHVATLENWNLTAFYASGLIFPLAVVLGKVLRKDFMKAKGPVDSVLAPAFIGMFLFWPGCIAAFYTAPDLVPLILAVGMAAHWPVIGWSYGRMGIYVAHAVVRAVAVTALWFAFPDYRLMYIPGVVALIYLISVIALIIDSDAVARKLKTA